MQFFLPPPPIVNISKLCTTFETATVWGGGGGGGGGGGQPGRQDGQNVQHICCELKNILLQKIKLYREPSQISKYR